MLLNPLEGTLRHDWLHKRQGICSEIFLPPDHLRVEVAGAGAAGMDRVTEAGWTIAWPTVARVKGT